MIEMKKSWYESKMMEYKKLLENLIDASDWLCDTIIQNGGCKYCYFGNQEPRELQKIQDAYKKLLFEEKIISLSDVEIDSTAERR